MAQSSEQKKANLRMGLVLASIAAVFFVGFMVKMLVLGG
ncbi:MAG: cytochrome oxidase small assembly protein [Rhodoferax sp.]|nr:cytochrome oxidase small assembly protein [Rhodoferax sp.]